MFRNSYNDNIPNQLSNDESLIRFRDNLWNETDNLFSQSPQLDMDGYDKHNSDSNDNYPLPSGDTYSKFTSGDDYPSAEDEILPSGDDYSSIIENEKLPSDDSHPDIYSDNQPLKRKASTNSEQPKKRIYTTKFNGNIYITENISVNCSKCKIEMNWEECSIVDEKIICKSCLIPGMICTSKDDRKCPRCTYQPLVSYVNKKGNVLKTCSVCRNKQNTYTKEQKHIKNNIKNNY